MIQENSKVTLAECMKLSFHDPFNPFNTVGKVESIGSKKIKDQRVFSVSWPNGHTSVYLEKELIEVSPDESQSIQKPKQRKTVNKG